MGRPSPSQSVDRFIGVLVVVCASAVIVGLSVRAGSSLSSILRVAFDTANGRDGKSTGRRRRRSASSRAGQGRGAPREDEEADDAAEGEGDAYYAYAYGARSGRGPHGKGSGGRLVVHRGSCHCGELTFEVDAPEHLVAIEGPGKVRYPFVTVPAERFRLTSDDSNGSLYLLKCNDPAGRNVMPKVSAHFFCRRCGVHLVHAPDFPHAAVANVNVHCIQPETIASLAVGFVGEGGVELPGMGDPVEGMYEVSKDVWSDAMRERLHAALEQQLPSGGRDGARSSVAATSACRALSPVRRPGGYSPKSVAKSASGGFAGGVASATVLDGTREGGDGLGGLTRVTDDDDDQAGFHGRGGDFVSSGKGSSRTGITALGAGGTARKMTDMGALLREAEESDRGRKARYYSVAAGSSHRERERETGPSWGDVLMHVVSLPSTSSSSVKTGSAGDMGRLRTRGGTDVVVSRHRDAAAGAGAGVRVGGGAGPMTDEEVAKRWVQQRRRLAGDGKWDGVTIRRGEEGGAKAWPNKPRVRSSAESGTEVGVGVGYVTGDWLTSGGVMRRSRSSSRRRSLSLDTAPAAEPAAATSSPGAQGVTSLDGGEASGGERSTALDGVSSGGGSLGRSSRAVLDKGNAEERREGKGVNPGLNDGGVTSRIAGGSAFGASCGPAEGTESDCSAEDCGDGGDGGGSSRGLGWRDGQPVLVKPPPARGVVSGGHAALHA